VNFPDVDIMMDPELRLDEFICERMPPSRYFPWRRPSFSAFARRRAARGGAVRLAAAA
jgi:hypothetical protein